MPVDESVAYLELKGKLENLSKGIVKHSADKDFPPNISTKTVDDKIVLLAEKRKVYAEAAALALQKSKEYAIEAETCEQFFSDVSTQLYGFHGKHNLVVTDYGLKIWQKHNGRKGKQNAAASK